MELADDVKKDPIGEAQHNCNALHFLSRLVKNGLPFLEAKRIAQEYERVVHPALYGEDATVAGILAAREHFKLRLHNDPDAVLIIRLV